MTLNDILVYTGKFGANLKAQNKEGQKSEVVKLILLI